MKSSRKVLGVSRGNPHKIHEAWMDSVGEIKTLPNYETSGILSVLRYFLLGLRNVDADVVICEDGLSTAAGISMKIKSLLKGREIKVLRIFADKGVHDSIIKGRRFTKEWIGYRFLDGGIAVSEMTRKEAEENYNLSVESVFPFVPEMEKYKEFVPDNYSSKNVLCIGSGVQFKNLDSLAEAVKGLDVTLHLVGNHDKQYSQDNVVTHGWVEDLTDVMEKCDLYVQSSTYEAFGVAPCEAMAAGIPAIVTDKTGCRPFVEEVDPELVTEGSAPQDIREKIEYYYSLSEEEREDRGRKARQAVSDLTEENQVAGFRKALGRLLE